jgi:hypothetical protein
MPLSTRAPKDKERQDLYKRAAATSRYNLFTLGCFPLVSFLLEVCVEVMMHFFHLFVRVVH